MSNIENLCFHSHNLYPHMDHRKVAHRCIKRLINISASTFSHISTNAQLYSTHVQPQCSPAHPHAYTQIHAPLTISPIFSSLYSGSVIACKVSPGNSWASSASFSTLNKDSSLIGPALPRSLFSHQSDDLFTREHS